jgi:hypothetical protein
MVPLIDIRELTYYVEQLDEYFTKVLTGEELKGEDAPPPTLDFSAKSLGEMLDGRYIEELKGQRSELPQIVAEAKIGYALLKVEKETPDVFE